MKDQISTLIDSYDTRKFSHSFQSPNIQLILINNAKTFRGYQDLMRALIPGNKEERPEPNISIIPS